ncbi:unnamed protein product [Hydatigera taeniaeformis]|uniref:Mannose-P-dolichol utilization defect 1 protein homolog n=1 Tax=Hydatigena taeniaeformis TaxID=6205 RepID=A0A0R3WN25_HYDTA|nr:unnamed protein product [Hydatigera taeniaeformis]
MFGIWDCCGCNFGYFRFLILATSVKLPQIIKILRTGSAKGLSILGGLLELLCYTATSSYSIQRKFPFSYLSQWLRLFCRVHSLIRSGILFAYLNAGGEYAGHFALSGNFGRSNALIVCLQGLQICTNFRNGSTGQLSAISIFLMTAGSLARIFTSVQETGDVLVILNFVVSSLVNIVLSVQIIYYWNSPLHEQKVIKNKTE